MTEQGAVELEAGQSDIALENVSGSETAAERLRDNIYPDVQIVVRVRWDGWGNYVTLTENGQSYLTANELKSLIRGIHAYYAERAAYRRQRLRECKLNSRLTPLAAYVSNLLQKATVRANRASRLVGWLTPDWLAFRGIGLLADYRDGAEGNDPPAQNNPSKTVDRIAPISI